MTRTGRNNRNTHFLHTNWIIHPWPVLLPAHDSLNTLWPSDAIRRHKAESTLTKLISDDEGAIRQNQKHYFCHFQTCLIVSIVITDPCLETMLLWLTLLANKPWVIIWNIYGTLLSLVMLVFTNVQTTVFNVLAQLVECLFSKPWP